MPFAFGHLIVAWLAGKGYESISKIKISHNTWFFLLLGGILPDADFLIDLVLKTDFHRTYSHSFLFLILIAILVYFVFYQSKEKKQFSLAIGTGILVHLFLDFFGSPGIPLFWPNFTFFSSSFIGPINLADLSFGTNTVELNKTIKRAIFDMGLGTAWIFYFWFRKRIRF